MASTSRWLDHRAGSGVVGRRLGVGGVDCRRRPSGTDVVHHRPGGESSVRPDALTCTQVWAGQSLRRPAGLAHTCTQVWAGQSLRGPAGLAHTCTQMWAGQSLRGRSGLAMTCTRVGAGQSLPGLAGLAIGAVAVGVGRDAARGLPTALGPAGTVDSLLGSAAGLVAAGCAGWLALVMVVASARVLPSGLGRVAALVGDAVTPPLLRRGLAVALGAGLAFGAAPAPAGAGTRPTPSPSPTQTSVPMVVLDRPAAPPAPRAPSRDATVTVRPGDSLWSIAARSLGPAATDRIVARAWPAWWAANRTVVGPDPDLILPGQRLTPPPDPSAHLETR